MKTLLTLATITGLMFCISSDAQAQNKCTANCKAGCNKHWPNGAQNSECKSRCQSTYHC
jgi:hypothetical protein